MSVFGQSFENSHRYEQERAMDRAIRALVRSTKWRALMIEEVNRYGFAIGCEYCDFDDVMWPDTLDETVDRLEAHYLDTHAPWGERNWTS